jgi:hypothetical protein
MALKQPFAVKQVLGNTDLELTAKPGESLLIWDILSYDPALDYITVKIDKTSVGYFRVRSDLGAHQFSPRGRRTHTHQIRTDAGSFVAAAGHYPIVLGDNITSGFLLGTTDAAALGTMSDAKDAVRQALGARTETLLSFLKRKGLWTGWPVAEGETFLIEGGKNTNGRQIVIYQIFDGGDMKPEMPNGSRAKEYILINYGNCGGSIQATVDNIFSTSKNPAEFPDFPFGKTCPSKYEVDILGVAGSPFAPRLNDNTDYSFTRYLKLIKDREVLFDEDRMGILFEQRNLDLGGRRHGIAEGISLIGNNSEFDGQEPLMFDPPLHFTPGDELGVYVSLCVGGAGQAISIYQHEIALIERIKRVE